MTEAKKMAMKLRATVRGCTDCDAKETRKLAKLIGAGKNKEAQKFMRSMDTFVREGIPEDVYQYIMLNQTKTRKIVPFVVKLKGCKKQIGDPEQFKPGEIFKAEYEFPGNATKMDISLALMRAEDKIIKDLIQIDYEEPKKRRIK